MKNKKVKAMLFSVLLAASLCLTACGQTATTPDPTVAPTATQAVEPTAEPTATTAPTATPEPTATPTPEPTATPTPEPTATPTPQPTATPAPEVSDGSLDLTSRISVWGQDIGVQNDDGSITFEGGLVDKCAFPLPDIINSGDTVTLTVKVKFASANDTAVRFYLTDDSINNCTEEIIAVPNTAEEVETTVTLKAAQTATAVMFASASYDVKLQNVTLCSIIVSGTEKEEPAASQDSGDWLSAWATTEEKCNLSGPTDGAMPKLALEGTTIRQIIRVTAGGTQIRFRLSNQYGECDVEVNSMHVAKQSKDALADGKGHGNSKVDMSTILPETDVAVTVNGQTSFVIPKGKVIFTDPIDLAVEGLDNLAISMYFGKAPTTNITGHRGARATTYQMKGDQTTRETYIGARETTAWYFLADCAVLCPGGKAVVFFGDSITDGYGTDAGYLGKKPDSYTRYIDYLAKRLQANEATKKIAVLNEGLGSNSVLGAYPTVSGKQRFSRDVLEHDNVGYVVIYFGVNDIGKVNNTAKYNQLIPEYKKMVDLCHANGIKVYAAPVTPFGTSDYYTAQAEELRTMVNDWMRSEESGFDGIIDFESVLADPANPINLLYEYTKADGLHPYEGYSAMADSVDLNMFLE